MKGLFEATEVKRGKFTPRPRNDPRYYGGNIPFVQTGDVTNSKGLIFSYTQTLNEEGLSVSTLFKKDTILMTIAANIGYTGILAIDMACPDSLIGINGIGIDNIFLNNYFIFKRQDLENLSTSGAQKNLSLELLKPFQIPVPPLKEQKRIAQALNDIDGLISNLEELIAKKQSLKQGAMQELLKPKEGWEVKRLGEMAELTSSKRVYLTDYVNEGIPFYRGKEISELKKNIEPNDILYITEKSYFEFKRKYGIPHIDDILITAVGTLGNIYRIRNDKPFYFKDGNLIWLRNIVVNSVFLEFLLEFKKQEIENSAIGSSQKALTIVVLRNKVFSIPPLPEQKRIAKILSEIDEELAVLENKRTKYQQFKTGMMQELLTGKIRLK